jgi:hypothetical protein
LGPQRIAVLQCIVAENDGPKLDCQISTRAWVQPKDFLGWKEFTGGIGPAPWHHGPVPGAVRLSPAQFVQIRHGLLRGARPLLTLREMRAVTVICYRGFLDVGGSISSALAADEKVICYEVVRIDDMLAVEHEMKASDQRPVLMYDGDEEYRTAWSGNHRLALHGDRHPPMPLDAPHWVIPGVVKVELPLRQIPCANGSHVGEVYVFEKPNGDIIAFNKKMAKAEAKGAKGTARKASAKRYRETDDARACVAKGE